MTSPTLRAQLPFLVLGAMILSVGCGEQPGADDTSLSESLLEPANLSAFDPSVRAQYRELRAALDASLLDQKASSFQRSETLGEMAMWFHAYGLLESAQKGYLAALRLTPSEPRWNYYLAHIERRQGHLQSSVDSFQRVVDTEPMNLAALVWLGEASWEQGQSDAAHELFLRAVQVDPGSAAALAGLARTAVESGDLPRGIETYERALALQPEASSLRYALGQAYLRSGNRSRAEEELSRVPAENNLQRRTWVPDSRMEELHRLNQGGLVHQDLGLKSFKAGRFREAAAHFRRSLESDPSNSQVLLNLAVAVERTGDTAAAERFAREAIASDPSLARAHTTLGTFLLRSHQTDSAQKEFEVALELDPSDSRALFNLAQVYKTNGLLEEALVHYGQARALSPSLVSIYHGHAVALLWLDREGEAIAALEKDLKSVPDAWQLNLLLARCLATARDPRLRDAPRALSIARTTLQSRGASLQVVESLTMSLAASGLFEDAVAWQTAALKAAKASNRTDILPRLEARLKQYLARREALSAWSEGETFEELPVTPP